MHITPEQRIAALQSYIDRTKRILELSSPQLNAISGPDDYCAHLQNSFREIGELGRENIKTLETYLFPLVNRQSRSAEDVEALQRFSSLLIDTTNMENMDLPLIYLQAERILESAEANAENDLRSLILALDSMVIASYTMFNLTSRLYPERDECYHYRDVGMAAGFRLLEYLPKDRFELLPDDECRELVVINARYIRCLFEWDDRPDQSEMNARDLALMRQALALAEDPYYLEKLPDYRWDLHVFRTLQYLSDFTEDNNVHGFTPEQLAEIDGYTQRLQKFLAENPDLTAGCPPVELAVYVARNSYFGGRSSLEEYRKELIRIIHTQDGNDFSARGMFVNMTVPMEYMLTLDMDHLSDEDQEEIRKIYAGIAGYAYHLPKTGVLSFMLTFLADVLKTYHYVPGGMPFSEMCQRIMAAMHPPTYVHTLNVADITKSLAEALMEKEPERFVGLCGTDSVSDVLSKKEEILHFVYEGALLHDIGKLLIVETIMTYGRNLIDSEFRLLQAHTDVGAALLRRHPETQAYAEIARGHHKWYDGTAGYPDDFLPAATAEGTVVSILTVADCMDAATDAVGRSYKGGKQLEEFIDELRAGKNTRYAPFVVDLFEDPAVCAGMEVLLGEGRDENYRKTYYLLKSL